MTQNKIIPEPRIAVIIPSYKVKSDISKVIAKVPPSISWIIVVDDCCPENTGEYVQKHITDSRVSCIFHQENTGVGGAMISGYKQALSLGADICIKIDGDGQMDLKLIPSFVTPIIINQADYTKGNRFFFLDYLKGMPLYRKVFNLFSSFASKFTCGYWDIFDTNNGYTAIHAKVLKRLPLDNISQRFFFETDMLFQLNLVNAKVMDIPMQASYTNHNSNFSLQQEFLSFGLGYVTKFIKRVVYKYFVRDFNFGSLQLLCGSAFFIFSVILGLTTWINSSIAHTDSSAGSVVLFAVLFITGVHLLIGFVNYDINATPIHPILIDDQ